MNLSTEKRKEVFATIVFPVRGDEVLLAIKGRSIGVGSRNAYGGGKEKEDKNLRHCAVRELHKESHLIARPEDMEWVGNAHFLNEKEDGTTVLVKCAIYIIRTWTGKERSTPEMLDPRWFSIDNLPIENMMLADCHWVPLVLGGKKVIVEARYGPRQETLKSITVTEVETLPELI